MNTQKAQEAINSLVLKGRFDRQYPAAKHQIEKLTELGILDLMPICNHPSVKAIGHTDAKLVIAAAEDSGKMVGGFTASGEGDVVFSGGSDLWRALNEQEPTPEPEEAKQEVDDSDPEDEPAGMMLYISTTADNPRAVEVEVMYDEDTYDGSGTAYLRPATQQEVLQFVGLEMENRANPFKHFAQWLYVVAPDVYSNVAGIDHRLYGLQFRREERGLFGDTLITFWRRAELVWQYASRLEFIDAAQEGAMDYVTPAQAAEMTRYAESTWRNYCAGQKVPGAVKRGKQWLIPRSSVEFIGKHGFAK